MVFGQRLACESEHHETLGAFQVKGMTGARSLSWDRRCLARVRSSGEPVWMESGEKQASRRSQKEPDCVVFAEYHSKSSESYCRVFSTGMT